MARDDLDIPMAAHAGPAPGSARQGSSWRVSRHQAMLTPQTRRLLLIAGGVGGTLLALVGIYSLSGRHHAGIPVIEADARPLREKPKNPGGLEIAGADDAILGGTSGKDGMAPPPEAPAPAELFAQQRVAQTATPPTVSPSPPASQSVTSQAVASPARPAVTAMSVDPKSVAPKAVPPVRPSVPAKPSVAAAASTAAPASGGGTQVQLAALATEQAALSEWERLSKKMPDMLAAKHPAVSRTERDGKTYFRLRTGGFTDVAQATGFCQQVREKGGGCSIASF